MVLHFETTITSWGEGGQAVLKQQLGSSFGDLKIIVNGINLLLINELQNYLIQFDEIKVQYSLDLRKPISQDLAAFVTLYALRKIFSQYNLLIGRPTALSACTRTFTTTTDLPSSHKIQEQLYEGGKLLVEDVHSHWRFNRTLSTRVNEINNFHLLIQELEVAKTRGRLSGAENRRQQAFDASKASNSSVNY